MGRQRNSTGLGVGAKGWISQPDPVRLGLVTLAAGKPTVSPEISRSHELSVCYVLGKALG